MTDITGGDTGKEYVEDNQHNTGDTGKFFLGVRNDSATTTLTSDNGDYSGIAVDNKGRIITNNSTSTQTISATDFDIRDLTHVSDSVSIGDGTTIVSVLDLTSNNGLAVAIIDANGDQITSFGGGTQYAEGATAVTITGTAVMWEDTADTLRTVSAAKPLPVDLGTNNDVTVTGSVTANSGTNLNTSALALEAGGNLDSITTSVQKIDDNIATDGGADSGSNAMIGIKGSFDGNLQHSALGIPTTSDGIGANPTNSFLATASFPFYWNGGNFDRFRGNATDGLLVNLGTNNDVTVTGTVTANAGTGNFNINLQDGSGTDLTSTLVGADQSLDVNITQSALPSGASTSANQTTQITHASNAANSLSVIDDWDESNRAKVNIIEGQIGVSAGAGTIGTNTPRFTLASDDPAVASLSILDDWDNAASDGVSVSGDTAHDSPDGGEPVKIGGIAKDYTPDTDGADGGQTAVADDDRANLAANLQGELVTAVKPIYHVLDNVSTTYDDDPTSATSQNIDSYGYRETTISLTLAKANTPTDIRFEVEISTDGTNYAQYMYGSLGAWIYSQAAIGGGISRAVSFPISCRKIRLKVTATGTDATNTITASNINLYMRT